MQITIDQLKDGININHRKEKNFTQSLTLVVFNPESTSSYGKFSEPLSVRWYWTAQTCYCCIWGSIDGVHFNGSGKAGGYGYDKKSASFSSALHSAGFDVRGLDGTGLNEEAIKIIAEQLMGINKEYYTIVSAHG